MKLSTAFLSSNGCPSREYHPSPRGYVRYCVIDFKGSWDDHLPFLIFSYNNNYHSIISMAPFEALDGRRCRFRIRWFEVFDFLFLGLGIVYEAMEKVPMIRDMLKHHIVG